MASAGAPPWRVHCQAKYSLIITTNTLTIALQLSLFHSVNISLIQQTLNLILDSAVNELIVFCVLTLFRELVNLLRLSSPELQELPSRFFFFFSRRFCVWVDFHFELEIS